MERQTFLLNGNSVPLEKDGYKVTSIRVDDLGSILHPSISNTSEIYKLHKGMWRVYYRSSEPVCQYCGKERCHCTGEKDRQVLTTEKMAEIVGASIGRICVNYRNADGERMHFEPADGIWSDEDWVPMNM